MYSVQKIILLANLLFLVITLFFVVDYKRPTLGEKQGMNKNLFTKDNQVPADGQAVETGRTLKVDSTSTGNSSVNGNTTVNSTELNEITLSTDGKLFDLLGAYPSYKGFYKEFKPKFKKPHMGIKNNNEYCHNVDVFNMRFPENMLEEKNFMTTYQGLSRSKVMKKTGTIFNPEINKDNQGATIELEPMINNYFVKTSWDFHLYHKMGKHFMCPTQMYNHIPGHGSLTRKDKLLDSLDQYAKHYKNKPECFNKTDNFPAYYRLYNKKECQDFFKLINSQNYTESLKHEPVQWLVKVGFNSHKGEGVSVLDNSKTQDLNKKYANGQKCGTKKRSLIVQSYITNPLLLDMNNKFDFRVYVLVASTNPLIVYYHDGFLRVSINPFNKASDEKATHLTNTHVAKNVIASTYGNGKTINNMTKEEIENYQSWDFEQFQNYLLASGKISDPNWLDNYLRPQFHKALVHLMRMTSYSFLKSSNVYEIQGHDFMLDNNMNLWYIEANPTPALGGSDKREKMYIEIVKDAFDIMYAYYRSRMTRLVELIKSIKVPVNPDDEFYVNSLRIQYEEAMFNKLQKPYRPKKKNSYKLIIDEGLPVSEAYFGMLPKQCVVDGPIYL